MRQGRPKVIFTSTVSAVLYLIVAVGAGLGAVLAAQRRSSPRKAGHLCDSVLPEIQTLNPFLYLVLRPRLSPKAVAKP